MKNILVILDKEEDQRYVIDRAVTIAEKLECDIHVLIDGYHELSWVNDVFSMLENIELKKKIIQQIESWWQEYSEPYGDRLTITHEIIWAKYFTDAILKHCVNHQYNFIVKKVHTSESILYTPNDWMLLRRSKIPTYLIVSKKADINACVLVALDLLANSEEKQKLNSTLLSVANDYVTKTGSELHCCFAIAIPKILADMGLIDIERRSQELKAVAQERADILMQSHNIAAANMHIELGTPCEVINRVSETIEGSLNVVGSMGKTTIAGKVIGNTCEQVLNSSKKDVLVVGLYEQAP